MTSRPTNGKSHGESGLEPLTDFALGELEDDQRDEIVAKLRDDPNCEEIVRHHAALARQLKDALIAEASASQESAVRQAVLERLDDIARPGESPETESKEKPSVSLPQRSWTWQRALNVTAIATCLVFLLAFVLPAAWQRSRQWVAENDSFDEAPMSQASEFRSSLNPPSDSLISESLASESTLPETKPESSSNAGDASSSPTAFPNPIDAPRGERHFSTGDLSPAIANSGNTPADYIRSHGNSTPPSVGSIAPTNLSLPAQTPNPITVHVPDGGTALAGGVRLEMQQQQQIFMDAQVDEFSVLPSRRRREFLSDPRSAEQYEAPPENPFVPVVDYQALSTFAIDVDTASYANVRRFINSGQRPPVAAVRLEEMINYFNYGDAAPSENQPFSVHAQIASCPWSPAHRLLRVALKGKEIPREERPLSNLVFLIDVSGSMQADNKLPLLKQALLMLTDQLTENDQISIVTYAGDAGLKLPSTNGSDKQTIRDAIRSLQAGGSTHGSAGIQLAYEVARQNMIEGGVNRVMLATDGDLNVGITADESLVDLITQEASGGVFLTVLGLGTGNLKDAKLEKIADHGNGIYAYIDSMREGRKVLLEQMSATFVTIAKDVKIQIEFNPQHVREYRLIGYENRVMAAEDFRNDVKDAGELGAGHSVVALYEIVPQSAPQSSDAGTEKPSLRYQQIGENDSPESDASSDAESQPRKYSNLTDDADSDEWLFVRLRYKQPDEDEATELGYPVTDEGTSLNRAGADFQFAAAVASFGMLLKQSEYAGSTTFSMIEEIASGALGEDPHGHRTEFLDLVRKASSLH